MPRREEGAAPGSLLTGLAALKAELRQAAGAAFRTAAESLNAAYTAPEVQTFEQQVREAKAYQADASADCPMLGPLAVARGIDLADLAGRVLAKHAAYSARMGSLMGQRQAIEDRLDAAQTEAEVRAVKIGIQLAED